MSDCFPGFVTEDNIGYTIDVGGLEEGKLNVKAGAGITILEDGTLTVPAPGAINRTIYPECYAGGTTSGTQAGVWQRNSTITRLGVGRWRVSLDVPHADGALYHVSFVTSENPNRRDTPFVTIEQNSQTANGFIAQVTRGDNGGAADTLVDVPWSFGVCCPTLVLVPFT